MVLIEIMCPDCGAKQINESRRGTRWCIICGWEHKSLRINTQLERQ